MDLKQNPVEQRNLFKNLLICSQYSKYDFSQESATGHMSRVNSKHLIIIDRSITTNAADKSNNINSARVPSSKLYRMSLCISIRVVSVE